MTRVDAPKTKYVGGKGSKPMPKKAPSKSPYPKPNPKKGY